MGIMTIMSQQYDGDNGVIGQQYQILDILPQNFPRSRGLFMGTTCLLDFHLIWDD
jgi:hypothetical protein